MQHFGEGFAMAGRNIAPGGDMIASPDRYRSVRGPLR
jgi:hypothetical protein